MGENLTTMKILSLDFCEKLFINLTEGADIVCHLYTFHKSFQTV